MGFLLKMVGIGKSAVGGYGWVLLLVGLLPSAFFAWDTYQTRGKLADCQEARALESEAALENALTEMERLNTLAADATRTLQTIRESSDAFRSELASIDVACDLTPIRDGLQRHLDTVRAAREAAVAP